MINDTLKTASFYQQQLISKINEEKVPYFHFFFFYAEASIIAFL